MKRDAPRMPRDHPGTANRQAEAEEESQYEVRMSELFDTLLDRHPRIALGFDTRIPSQFSNRFRWIGAECCRAQHTEKGNCCYDPCGTQHPSRMAIRPKKTRRDRANGADRHFLFRPWAFKADWVRRVHFRWRHPFG